MCENKTKETKNYLVCRLISRSRYEFVPNGILSVYIQIFWNYLMEFERRPSAFKLMMRWNIYFFSFFVSIQWKWPKMANHPNCNATKSHINPIPHTYKFYGTFTHRNHRQPTTMYRENKLFLSYYCPTVHVRRHHHCCCSCLLLLLFFFIFCKQYTL